MRNGSFSKSRPHLHFRTDRKSGRSFYEQVRDQLVNHMHFGAIQSGARLPTVRRLARDCRINIKTAFKIYQALAKEGLVEIRPQSGVFARSSQSSAERAYRRSVSQFLSRVESEAKKLNLALPRLTHLLAWRAGSGSTHGISCAVLECNREQTELFSREIERRLNVRAFPVELQNGSISPEARETLRRADFLVTTDFHWDEVNRLARASKKKTLRVQLDPRFLNMLLAAARRGPLAMVVTETSFEPRFREAVAAYLTPRELDRIRFVPCDDRRAILAARRECRSIYVSPLCEEKVRPLLRRHPRLLRRENMISSESLAELKENLLFYPLL